jgi:hypothetical protein
MNLISKHKELLDKIHVLSCWWYTYTMVSTPRIEAYQWKSCVGTLRLVSHEGDSFMIAFWSFLFSIKNILTCFVFKLEIWTVNITLLSTSWSLWSCIRNPSLQQVVDSYGLWASMWQRVDSFRIEIRTSWPNMKNLLTCYKLVAQDFKLSMLLI